MLFSLDGGRPDTINVHEGRGGRGVEEVLREVHKSDSKNIIIPSTFVEVP